MRDGETIEVAANVGSAADAAAAVEFGADGVGLLRTEFLFLDRDEEPSEDEQRAVYEEIAAALDGRPVIIRTLDAGADKPLPVPRPGAGGQPVPRRPRHPALPRTPRAAAHPAARDRRRRGSPPVKVMFPMVATLEEYRAGARDGRRRHRGRRDARGPAVALQADAFAREVDFFSVGTNDLTQYTMAAERGNEALAGLLAGPRPPVLRLIERAVEAANAHGRWVGVCGELAGDPEAAVVLAGLGVRELSMAAGRIPEVKEALRPYVADARRAAAGARPIGGVAARPTATAAGAHPVRRVRVGLLVGRVASMSSIRSARFLAASTCLRIFLTPVIMAMLMADASRAHRRPVRLRGGDRLGRRLAGAPLGGHDKLGRSSTRRRTSCSSPAC